MSAMREMSKAIREVLEAHAPTLPELPLETLNEVTTIVGAYYFDLKAEQERRLEVQP